MTEINQRESAKGNKMKAKSIKAGATDTERVFVYGTLIKGEYNERWAINVRARIAARVRGKLYDVGCFPALYPNPEAGECYGEIITTNAEGLASMDRLEGYPRLYRRERVKATDTKGVRHTCWVYVMNADPIERGFEPIECGSWVAYRKAVGK